MTSGSAQEHANQFLNDESSEEEELPSSEEETDEDEAKKKRYNLLIILSVKVERLLCKKKKGLFSLFLALCSLAFEAKLDLDRCPELIKPLTIAIFLLRVVVCF